MKCIRELFCAHASCKPVHGLVPDPFKIDQLEFPMTTSNLSYILDNIEIIGFNGRITSFYINKNTDNLVFAFEVKNVTLATPRLTIIFNRKGKEPIKLTDTFFTTFGSATFTATIPNIKHLQMDKAYAYAYLDDSNPDYDFGPGFWKSCDPIVSQESKSLLRNIPEISREALIVQAFNYLKIFVQNTICDFGLPITNPRN
uniref:Fibrohexamerin homolog3 n=1 Tax=Samia ricini TaxID=63990 RepID=A0A0M4U1I3_SAMRI|nr:fibrohexamerin homolog3 [Samia ricini]